MNFLAIIDLTTSTMSKKKAEFLIRSLRNDMHRSLPENFQARICYTGKKRGTKFNNIKDPVKKSNQSNVVFYATSHKPGCVEDNTAEKVRRLNKTVIDPNRRDKKLHLYKHSQEIIIRVLH